MREATVDETGWLRPVTGTEPREPRWGHPDGLQIGLHPLGGPRGLIRVFTPYLDHPRDRLVNFFAIEPVPAGQAERGYSELERSRLDDVPGLRFWSADEPADATARMGDEPARGVVDEDTLSVSILSEPFANGADVWVTVTFTRDRPHEVRVATFARESSVSLASCIVSATMGNWARLRELELGGRTVRAAELWPDYRGSAFAPHASFGVDELLRDGDEVVFRARPDEDDPAAAIHADGTAAHWHYTGRRGAQEWRVSEPDPALRGQVNGRHTYWMSEHPLPGGIAFENVELVEPFRHGRAFTFRVEPL